MEDTAQKSNGSDEFPLQLEPEEEEMSVAIAVLDQNKPLFNQDSDCTICGDPFEQKSITVLPCGHQFCTRCIDEWFKIKQTCPFCRAGPDQDKADDNDEDNPFIDLFEELIEELGLADWNENWDLEGVDDNDNGDGDEPVLNHHQDTTTFYTMLSDLIRNQQENENSQTLSSFFDSLDGLFRDYSRLSQTNPVVNLQQVDHQMNQQPVIPLPWYETQLEWATGPSIVTQEDDVPSPF